MPRPAHMLTALAIALVAAAAGQRLVYRSQSIPPASESPSVRAPVPTVDESPSTPLLVEHGGCKAIVDLIGNGELTCVYTPNTTLRLWVLHSNAADAEILVDGRPITEAKTYDVEHEPGQGRYLTLGSQAHDLTVQLDGTIPWSLALRDEASLEPDLVKRRKAFLDRARTLQVRLSQGDTESLPEVHPLVRDGLSQGLISDAIWTASGLAYFAGGVLEQPQFARQLLESFQDDAERFPEGRAMMSIFLSRPLRLLGYRREAAISAREGSRSARRMKDVNLAIDGLSDYSLLLAQLGYVEAAAQWGAEALALGREHRVDQVPALLEVVAAANLLLKQAGQRHENPGEYYDELLELSRPGGVYFSHHYFTVAHLGLAELAMLDQNHEDVLSHLQEIDVARLPLRGHAIVQDLDLKARVVLGFKRSILKSKLRELERIAIAPLELGVQWRIAVRRGHVLESLGDHTGARDAYEHSEDLLDDLLPLAALGIGGEALIARHDEGTQRLLSLLLHGPAPDADAALCVARRGQARLSRLSMLINRLDEPVRAPILPDIERYLEAKRAYERLQRQAKTLPKDELQRALQRAELERKELQGLALEILSVQDGHEVRTSCDQLSPRRSGELLLGLYPLGNDLLVIWSDDDGSAHHWWRDQGSMNEAPDLMALAPQVLDLLSDRIDRAQRIRVLGNHDALRVSIHALPHNGGLLGLQRSVVYGLELPPPVPRGTGGPRSVQNAVVLQDVKARGSAAAATTAAQRLAALDFEVSSFDTEHSESDDVRKNLLGADHFFYAGHAYFHSVRPSDEGAGAGSWPPYPGGAATEPAYLPLGTVARLEVADISMLHPAPLLAVLMGCATGVTDARTAYGGQSLATAFLGAGTSVAIASTRTVESSDAFKLSRNLYRHFSPDVLEDPGEWMRQAMLSARADGLNAESLADYRVFVP